MVDLNLTRQPGYQTLVVGQCPVSIAAADGQPPVAEGVTVVRDDVAIEVVVERPVRSGHEKWVGERKDYQIRSLCREKAT